MFRIAESITRILLIFAVFALLLSCTTMPMIEYSGIPIADYEASQKAAEAAKLEQLKENDKAVAELSKVRENQVLH